jgi:hypothetical protein
VTAKDLAGTGLERWQLRRLAERTAVHALRTYPAPVGEWLAREVVAAAHMTWLTSPFRLRELCNDILTKPPMSKPEVREVTLHEEPLVTNQWVAVWRERFGGLSADRAA